VLDAELVERPADLGQAGLVHRLAGRGRVEVVAASVGIEGREQAVCRNRFLQSHKARRGTLFLDQDSREDRACGIVQGHHEIERRSLRQPGGPRAVLKHQHARPGPARPLLAVGRALRRLADEPT